MTLASEIVRPSELTSARLAWLRKLANGPAERPRSRVGYDCMRLGWAEWNTVDDKGANIPCPAPGEWRGVVVHGERLTENGRQVLRQAGYASDLDLDEDRAEWDREPRW